MSPSDIARGIGAGRALIGASLVIAPTLAGSGWLGRRDAGRPTVRALLRGLGIRDLILGGLVMHVADRPGIGYRTVATAAVADAVDCAAFMGARSGLTPVGGQGVIALAGASAAVGAVLAAAMRQAAVAPSP